MDVQLKRLIELHCGSIEARSEGARKGSEFVVRLPLAIDHDLAGQPCGKVFLKGKSQVFPPGFCLDDFRPLHDRLQAAADSLDFR